MTVISKQEVDDNLRLLPWFRYAKNWPDPWECRMVYLLALTTLALHDACLVGNPAPKVKEMYERMSHPQVDDIVLEHGTRWHKDWPERALGRLTNIEKDPLGGNYYFVEPLYYDEGTSTTRWENASFIAIPIDETKYLDKRGPVVFTRGSLMAELSTSGFGLRA